MYKAKYVSKHVDSDRKETSKINLSVDFDFRKEVAPKNRKAVGKRLADFCKAHTYKILETFSNKSPEMFVSKNNFSRLKMSLYFWYSSYSDGEFAGESFNKDDVNLDAINHYILTGAIPSGTPEYFNW